MDSEQTKSLKRRWIAFILPMAMFVLFLGLDGLLRGVGGSFWIRAPQYWIYPIQTVVCGLLLIWYRREYPFGPPRQILFTVALALVVFLVWIAPQQILGFAPRRDGFNPGTFFSNQPPGLIYWSAISFRFLRLVVVVPFLEEIFFRGFLLRYLIREEFETVAVGTFSMTSFMVVSIGFGLVHSPADWIAGLVAGALYNGVSYRTRSLSSCVLAHGITNLLLGLWIMKTEQWGFW